jgi:hypothetical protein
MAEQNHIGIQSFTNSEASSAIGQYRVAVLDTAADNSAKLPAGANTIVPLAGVAIAEAAAGEQVSLVFAGIAYVVAYAAFDRGAILVVGDSAGRVAAKAAGATAQGLSIVGVAQKAAGAQGDIVPCLLQIHNEYAS